MRPLPYHRLTATRRQYVLYVVVYLLLGLVMNGLGKAWRIAEFATWFQVLSCYGLYLVPVSLLVRHLSVFEQYLRGLLALAPFEMLGYALGTSHAFENNWVDRILGERNFVLAMVVFFAWVLPAGNGLVGWLDRSLFRTVPEPLPPERL